MQAVVLSLLLLAVVCCSADQFPFAQGSVQMVISDDAESKDLSRCLLDCSKSTLLFVERICGTGERCSALFGQIASTVCGTSCSGKMAEETTVSHEDQFTYFALKRVTELRLQVSPYVKCWATCLGKSIKEVEKWAAKCKLNVKCWVKVAGFKAVKCAAKCIKHE